MQKQNKEETSTASGMTYARAYAEFVARQAHNRKLVREVDELLAKLGNWYLAAMTGAAVQSLPDTCFKQRRNPEGGSKAKTFRMASKGAKGTAADYQ